MDEKRKRVAIKKIRLKLNPSIFSPLESSAMPKDDHGNSRKVKTKASPE